MASTRGRGRNAATDTENTPLDPTVDTENMDGTPVEASTDETPGPAPEGTTPPEATPAAPTKAPVDKSAQLEQFKSVVTAAVTPRADGDEDTSHGSTPGTGAISDEVLATVQSAYTELHGDRKAQNAAKGFLAEELSNAVGLADDPDQMATAICKARSFLAVQKAIEETKPAAKAPKAPVDPTEDFVNRYATLNLAVLAAFNSVPEGVSEDWPTKSEELENSLQDGLRSYMGWLATAEDERGDEPEVSEIVKDAVKMAQGKSVTGRRKTATGAPRAAFEGERGDIAKHIAQAFASVPVGGTLSVSQIVAADSKGAGYDGRKPSQGAVSSRLKSAAWSVEATGIEPVADSAPFSARKVADVSAA